MKTVIIADDHQIILDGLKTLITKNKILDVIGTAMDGNELLSKTRKQNPDIVITDIEMPQLSGIEALKIIREEFPEIKTIVLSMHNDPVIESILSKIGVNGIIYKNANESTILKAITNVSFGKNFKHISKQTSAPILKEENSNHLSELTTREIQIIKLVAQGFMNKEIAEKINISPRTVDTHRTNIMKKLNLRSAVDLTRFAFMNKLV